MAIKINNGDSYEYISITLREDLYPIAHNEKVNELMEQGAFDNIQDAKKFVNNSPIELELYYEKHNGLIGIEVEAVVSMGKNLSSPYTREFFEECDEF